MACRDDTISYPVSMDSVNAYPICDSVSTLEIDAAQKYRNRAEITVLVCVNRSPIRYDFRAGAKAILYSVNIA